MSDDGLTLAELRADQRTAHALLSLAAVGDVDGLVVLFEGCSRDQLEETATMIAGWFARDRIHRLRVDGLAEDEALAEFVRRQNAANVGVALLEEEA